MNLLPILGLFLVLKWRDLDDTDQLLVHLSNCLKEVDPFLTVNAGRSIQFQGSV